MPEDEADLAYFLEASAGGNSGHRDRARLQSDRARRRRARRGHSAWARASMKSKSSQGARVRAGAAVPDVKVSRAAQEAAIAGSRSFAAFRGRIGGALRMNGGAYGRETKDALIEARGVDRQGRVRILSNDDMHYSYRHCGASEDIIFTEALFQGTPGDPNAIAAEMDEDHRFARGHSADQEPHRRLDLQEPARSQGLATHRRRRLPWSQARRRAGLRDALQFSHQSRRCHGPPTSKRSARRCARACREHSGVELEWEIKRIGVAS